MNNISFNKFYRKFNILSLILIVISLVFLIFKGLNYGVDFKGGTLIELRTTDKTNNISLIRDSFNQMNLGDVSVKKFGNETDFIVKFEKQNSNDPEFIKNIQNKLSSSIGNVDFRRVENVGPKVSSELLKSGIIAISLSLAAMLLYIWIRFEWQFSLGAILAIFHDVIITLGIFSIFSLEINLSIVAAVLTIVGYSMNDTVVIFDRVRENLRKYSDIKIFDLTNISINETLSRTIITSVTTLLALFSIYLFGGEILKGFSYRVLKEECLDLPDKVYIKREVELSKEQKEAYSTMKSAALALLKGKVATAPHVLTQMMRLHQITCGHLKNDDGTTTDLKNGRIDELIDLLDEVEGKVIIWANYVHDIEGLVKAISKEYGDETVVQYYGATSSDDRAKAIKSFQDPKSKVKYFIGNPQTAGYGITLTEAGTVVYFSNGYDLEKRLQSEDRAHRIGQTKSVTYVDFIAPKTVDEKIVKALRNKIDIASQVMGEELKEWI